MHSFYNILKIDNNLKYMYSYKPLPDNHDNSHFYYPIKSCSMFGLMSRISGDAEG